MGCWERTAGEPKIKFTKLKWNEKLGYEYEYVTKGSNNSFSVHPNDHQWQYTTARDDQLHVSQEALKPLLKVCSQDIIIVELVMNHHKNKSNRSQAAPTKMSKVILEGK